MSRKQTDTFVCDRCGALESPRENRNAEDDDGFPHSWAKVTFRDCSVSWEKDLCGGCANDVGKVIRTTRS